MKASLSLDLDNLWSYMKTHGDAGWVDYPSYLETVIPHMLALADSTDTAITVFIVGQDAAFDKNTELLAAIAEAGHEIGNHSFRHEPWIDRYSQTDVADELKAAHEAISTSTGREPKGYRGPGFSLSPTVLNTLAAMGYAYDASTLPTWIGPLARRYYFRSTHLTPAEVEQRSGLFGSLRDGLLPNVPYQWEMESDGIAEIPVTTMPLGRVPIHISYLLFLSSYSTALAEWYFRLALRACQLRRVGPSILLHPLDLLGGDEIGELEFFPGMDLAGTVKRERTARYVQLLTTSFETGTMADQLASLGTPTRKRHT